MKKILSTALALTLLAGTGSAFAQGRDDNRDHNNNAPVQQRQDDNRDHNASPGMAMHGPSMAMHGPGMAMQGPRHGWHQGGRIARSDWGRGQRIDYREHHLRKPPRGYEWRQVDNNYILAAAATGLIASIILASH